MNIKRAIATFLSTVVTFASVSNCFAWTEYYGDATDPERSQIGNIMDSIYKYDVGEFTGAAVGEETSEIIELVCIAGLMQKLDDGFFHSNEKLSKADFYTAISMLYTGRTATTPNIKNENVTMKEAVLAVVSALGYEYMATDEAGMLGVAANLELLKGISLDENKAITRGEFATVLYNALQVNPMELGYSTDGMTLRENDDIALNVIFDIYEVEGLFNSVPGINIYGGNSCRDGFLEISRQEYKASDEHINSGLLGRYVRGYVKYYEDADEYVLVYLEEEEESIEFNLDAIENVENNRIEYIDAEGNNKKIKISEVSNIIYNGDKILNLDKLSEISGEHGNVTVSSSEGKGEYDVVIIKHYSDFLINSILAYDEKISFAYGAKLNGENTVSAVPDLDKYIKVYLDGEKVTINELKVNQAVSVMSNLAGNYVEIYASTLNAAGKVTSYDDEDRATIDGDIYKVSPTYKECSKNNPQKAAEIKGTVSGTFYITADGWIAGYKASAAETYAVIVKIINDDEFDTLRLNVFTENSEHKQIELADKVTIDGKTFSDKNAIDAYLRPYLNKEYKEDYDYSNDGTMDGNPMSIHPIISYKNSSSGVKTLNTAMGDDITFNGMYKGDENDWMGLSSMIITDSPVEIIHRTFDDTVCFIIPENKDLNEYYVELGNSNMVKNANAPVQFFNEDNFYVADYVVCESGKKAVDDTAKGTVGTIFYVEKIEELYDEEEDEVTKAITGVSIRDNSILTGKRTTYAISDDLEEVTGFEKGNIYNLSVKQGEVYSAALFFDKTNLEPRYSRFESATRNWSSWYVARVEDIDVSTGWILYSYKESNGNEKKMSAKIRSSCNPVRLVGNKLEYVGTGAIQKGDLVWFQYGRSNIYSLFIIDE